MQPTSPTSLMAALILVMLGSAYFTASQLVELSNFSGTFFRDTTPVAQAVNAAAGVARWEFYEGSGFSLKHPPEWMVKQSGSATYLFPDTYEKGCTDAGVPESGSSCVYLKIVPKSNGVTYGIGSGAAIPADTLQKKNLGGHEFSFIDQKFEGVRLADYFLRVSSAPTGYMQFRYGERYVDTPDAVAPVSFFQTAERILGTVTFSDDMPSGSTSVTTSWKTYRNEQYGFEVKYPADFPFAETDRQFPPSLFTLLGVKDGNPMAAFFQIVSSDGINLFPFSVKIASSTTSLSQLAALFRARDNTKVVNAGLVVHVAVTDVHGQGGVAGLRTRVESESPVEGSPIVGVAYYFYKAPYFYRIISSVPGVDAEVSQIVSTFRFTQ